MKRTFSVTLCFMIAIVALGTAATLKPHSLFAAGPVPKEISIGDTTKKQVIFTFDCGHTAESADAIIDILAKHHVRGTFFVTGTFVDTYPQIIRKMAAGNNEIFNHTAAHPRLTQVSDRQIIQELAKLDMAIYKLVGTSTRPYFRPPYGDRDERVRAAAGRLGYTSVYWTTDALDWLEGKNMTAEQVKTRILDSLTPGAIYLMHVGDHITSRVLDDILTQVKKRGYTPVSLTQGL